jgi:hypothetical protein
MEFLEVIETIRAEEASVQKLFGQEGQGVRSGAKSPQYMKKLSEAAKLVADVMSGRRPAHLLREAMTTSDFPYLFGDILDRQLLAAYQETVPSWPNYCNRHTVRDFRTVKRYGVYGGDTVLDAVPEQHEYPLSKMDEDSPFSYAVKKYGRRMPFSWETMINDDLDALKDIPQRFGRAARRSEEKFATGLFVDTAGPHASFYTSGYKNIVTSNPALSISAIQTALIVLAAQLDQNSEPIVVDAVELVVPPALEIDAKNILNATTIWFDPNASAGTKKQSLVADNWMKNKLHLSVNAYIPIVASSSNGSTSWFLFANPSNGRPALELGFLRGHEQPEIFMKTPNAVQVGGGTDPMNGDFDTDSIEYKVRHVLGGSRMDPKMTVASNGSGS